MDSFKKTIDTIVAAHLLAASDSKDTSLLKELDEALKKAKKEYGEGMSIVDDPDAPIGDDTDDADKWLEEQDSKPNPDEKAPRVFNKDWEPRQDYSAKEQADIEKHVNSGYSHREAERLANAHKKHNSLEAAMRSGINPSMPSDRMINQLKGLASEWLESARNHEMNRADEEKNPIKHAAGQMQQAHSNHVADYHNAYSDFLASDAVKGLTGANRHKTVQEWKTKWKQDNPSYEEGLSGVSSVGAKYADAAKTIQEKNKDIQEHVGRGGVSSVPEMSTEEAMQHLGGGKGEEGYQGTIIKDPLAAFAERNPRLVSSLSDEQKDRMKRIDSAKVAAPAPAPAPAQAAPPADTATSIPKKPGEPV